MDRLHIKKSILLSQKCQRNYDLGRDIPQEDLDLLETAIAECPSERNLRYYDAHMITDREVIEKIHTHTAGIRARAVDANDTVTNPQVMGNLCVVFTEPRQKPEIQSEDPRSEQQVALGIAAGYLNLVSAQMGYRSGCSNCFHAEPIMDILGIEERPLLIMGIGFNNPERDRREHQLDPDFLFPTHAKMPIGVTWHK
jgi:nitroreductase